MRQNRRRVARSSSAAWAVALAAACWLGDFKATGPAGMAVALANDGPAPATTARAAPGQVAEPTAAAQAGAEKTIHELFKADYAKRDPSDRSALAQRLIGEAASEGDPTVRYVLLREARDLAASAGDYPSAQGTIDQLAAGFDIDAAGMRTAVLTAAAKSATTPNACRAVAEGAMSAIDQAVREDDYDTALKRLGAAAQIAAERAQDRDLLSRVSERLREVRAMQGEFTRYKDASKILARNANDAHANLAAGRFLAMVKADWERGLPMLSKAGDPAFVTIARRDLAAPTNPQEQTKLADDWLALAEKQPPGLKTAAQGRADHWYVLALPKLSGLEKLAVQKRLKDLPSSIDYGQLAARIAAGVDKTGRCGGKEAGGTTMLPVSSGLLIGFDYTVGRFENHSIVKSLRPIFLTANGKVRGSQHGKPNAEWLTVEARPGYAVGGVVTDGTNRFNGMNILFMRVHGTTLDADSAYESPWIGGHAAAKLDTLGGDGRPVVGIELTSGADIDTFGLIQAR